MHRFPSLARTSIAAIAALACLAAAPASSGGVAPAPEAERGGGSGAAAGLAATPITLATGTTVHGFDVAMGPDGKAYVGWIEQGSPRTIHSCTLPPAAVACLGGEKSLQTLGPNATGLQVLPPVGGLPATFVFHHDTLSGGPLDAKISTATVASDGTLANQIDTADAYYPGSLLAAERGPGGSIWIAQAPTATVDYKLQIRPLFGTGKTYNTPWLVGYAKFAFTAAERAVVVFDRAGQIGDKVRVVRQTDTGWSGISAVNGTWNLQGAFDVATQNGVHLVASINQASYHPRIAKWGGTSFGSFSLTGDKGPCTTYSHDLYPDSSGRFADAYFECDKVTITNHPRTKKAAFVRFDAGGTAVDRPQIATTPRGTGWVVWSYLEPGLTHRLRVAPIRLPALKTSKTVKKTFGKVTVSGPVSCLPAVQTTIGVAAQGLNGWSVVSKTLKLDGAVHGTGLNGTQFPPNTTHTVSGTGKFKKGGQTKSLTVSLAFKSCPDVAIS